MRAAIESKVASGTATATEKAKLIVYQQADAAAAAAASSSGTHPVRAAPSTPVMPATPAQVTMTASTPGMGPVTPDDGIGLNNATMSGQGPHLQTPDYGNIVAYLEVPSHKEKILGSSEPENKNKSKITGKSMNVGKAYTEFAEHINALYNSRMTAAHLAQPSGPPPPLLRLTGKQMRQRLVSLSKVFIIILN